MRRYFNILGLVALVFGAGACVVSAQQKSPQAPVQSQINKYMTVVVNKTEYRDDLTRVYACLVGRPHTSGRIDDIVLTTKDGKTYKFTDLDGVDPKRYFQWEDEGKIDIEIDFPPMPKQKSFSLQFDCANGIVRTAGK